MFTITTINHQTYDTQHPLLMLTNREGYRYLFGKVSEGSQRALNENKFRLAKLKGVFLSGTLRHWSQIGGLPGLFLTISDSTKKDIDVYATSGKILSYIVATWRYFVFRKGVELKVHDVENEKIIADSNILVKPIKIPGNNISSESQTPDSFYRQLQKLVSLMFPLDTKSVNDSDPNSYKSDPADNDIQTHISIADAKISPQSQQALSYLIRFVPLRGKFNPQKAKELGIKPGINYRLLTQGEPVTNDQGVVVNPDQVMGEAKHFKKVLVLDIPDNSYLKNTLECTSWFQKDDDLLGQEDIGVVYHLLGSDIDMHLDSYLNFINSFPADCQHIISHPSSSSNTLVFKTFASNLLKLRSIHKEAFNLPYTEPFQESENKRLHLLQQIHIHPETIEFDDSLVFKDDWSELYEEHVQPLKLNHKLDKEATLDPTPIPLGLRTGNLKDDVQVTTLGTGSALPSLHRNVISNLIRIPFRTETGVEFKTVLFDGGENTLGTLLRTFGREEQYVTLLSELGLIFLSHLHADHHLGLISVINKWFEVNENNNKVLHLVIPWQYDHFLNEWFKLEAGAADLSRINYISCEEFLNNRAPEYTRMTIEEFEQEFDRGKVKIDVPRDTLKPLLVEKLNFLYDDMKIQNMQTCRAIHCYWSYSVSVTFDLDQDTSFKVSYSGDTRPNPKFVEIGYGSDLLIHESSLDNDLIEEAIAKKHTTMIEAVHSSMLMNCPKLILTHFSTRYSSGANFISKTEDFDRLSNELEDYLSAYNSHNIAQTNLFLYSKSHYKPRKTFEELEILFAFDTLIVRLNQVGDQRKYIQLMNQVLDLDDESDTKTIEKTKLKRDARRLQRLASSHKKRKSSSDED